jgi:hypothetical protein
MPGYEETHWAATEEHIALFRKKIDKMRGEDRSTELMVEIAVQLMWLNANVQEAHEAINRIADNK